MIKTVIIVAILLSADLRLSALPEKLELKTTRATLTVDQKGFLNIVPEKGVDFQIKTPVKQLWKFVLMNSLTGKITEISDGKFSEISKEGNTIRIKVSELFLENRRLPAEVLFTISVKDGAFCFSGSLKGISEGWIFRELVYPELSGIKSDNSKIKIYWPEVLGQCFDSPDEFGSRSFEYPSNKGTMAWYSINSPASGLYVGSHDPAQEPKKFSLEFAGTDKSYKTSVTFPVYSDKFTIPDIMIKPYPGSWYSASRFYRSWYQKNFRIADVSHWARNCEGYMLNILKQQNGEVMYPYKDVDKLCDIAEKLNFRLIGLWGRGVGGHDRYYPNYMPDNLLGGREEMKNAIRRAHQRGLKVIVYTNGKIIDSSTDYYRNNGIETILLDEKGQPKLEYWLKHKNTAPVIFAVSCHGSALWRKTIMDLALEAHSLGADAFYIDQISQVSAMSNMCFSKFHDHKRPQEGWSKYRIKMVQEIRDSLRKIDPEFTIMTEGINDSMLPYVDMFQGIPYNVKDPLLFPEMFRYTFPESIAVALNSDPALTRWDANYAACYGLRHQIMSRYPADAEYLKYGKIPSKESYSNVTGPPDVDKFTKVSPGEITSYTYDLFKFENDYAEFFRAGKFIDEDGIVVIGEEILGKGFLSGNKIGVVVWNKSMTEEKRFTVTVNGYKVVKAAEPGKENAEALAPLQANSVRLLIFENN